MARVRFTDRFVQSVKVEGKGRKEHSDAICPGLYLRVASTGSKTFYIIVRAGKLKRVKIGSYPSISLATARQLAMEKMRKWTFSPAAPPLELPPNQATLSLRGLIDSYSKLHLQVRVKTWKNVLASLRQPAVQHLQDRPVDSIDKREIVDVLDNLVAAGKPHAATNLLKALRAAFNWANDRGDMKGNPCERVRQPVATTQRDRILTDGEIGRVLRACDHVPFPFGAMVRVLLHTGARRNEVAHMRWSELAGNVWTLPAARSKSGRANVLTLPPAVMVVITSMPRPADGGDGFIFSTTDGRRPSSDFTRRKRVLDEASRTSNFHLHDLRRSARSLMAKLGVDREVARRVIGHSVDHLDAIYDRHDYVAEKADALVRLADYLTSLKNGADI